MTGKRWIIFIAAVVAVLAGLIIYSRLSAPSVGDGSGSNNVYGKADSKVVLTEFVDFQCEACKGFYPTVKEVKEKYKDTVRFEIRYFPIATSHANARAAAATAQAAAKQGKFFEMHDMLFEKQDEWGDSRDRNAIFESYAEEIRLNMDQYRTDLSSPETQQVIQADLALVKKLGGDGTPTFALNGEKIDSPQNTVEAFTKLLDDALARNN